MVRAKTSAAAPRTRPARTALVLGAGVAALAGAVLLSLVMGSRPTPVADVWAAITGGADSFTTTVVESRYPRTVLGVVAGAALALAGTLMQGITRNPLADPGLLGVNAGAAAAVVTATALFGPTSVTATVWWALPGALVAGLAAYTVGSRGGDGGMVRLVLAGAVVSAVLTAYVQAVALSLPETFDSYRYWVVGSLAGRDYDVILSVLPVIGVGVLLALVVCGGLNALALGEEAAIATGANTVWIRSAGLVAGTLLAAGATAAAGPIAFVGLAVPHVVRALVGVDFRAQVPFALLVGPTLLLLADVVGRTIVRPTELMVGVVTAFVGAPVLLYAVRRMRSTP
ncbi:MULTISPECIES: FecCD family ABC transporter permease [Nocardiopsis]|uniref:Transport system permease protein n=1 Tax=Nocardiopsis dassonvillei (strain ATCC 23218 / DSM 43111 / CIP 107115 / JCM 7437 / KCTC 9190 / NBRC 14626 / NCTC 10488 / NRRL B-5397 / IMRU 509) TaxID=446468 RepID=D7B0V4_NOCDD|nr:MULTISPECIES: iron chelate uptake ABC transporter family permease subunit [Nocardiopsis]ADH68339.1 transport system permease protein [Nocardiopsis dassonvillei subsp. dassonvillei DSM 43111]APC36441.1 iron ABC transporter permease [Nocardiopsis dassonvillei]NKY81540.1 iron chelate uptake ABC transporter family permease subunit [Nocardiopsis dassonvillei]VEI88843.1 Ferric enterobactin transport system permease protein fepD [Nocardiopsis dassonvillei]